MVRLTRIYTRTGDEGTTALGDGARVAKHDIRIEAYGTSDETNSIIGLALIAADREDALAPLTPLLNRIQNDLFDLGADLATPDRGEDLGYEPLRIIDAQVDRLEADIDLLNDDLEPLNSFVLPGGTEASAHLHHARTVARRCERLMTALAADPQEPVSPACLKYMNRLSDLLFVAARWANLKAGDGDVLWVPGAGRN